VIACILLLLAGNVFLGLELFYARQNLAKDEGVIAQRQTDQRVIHFTNLVINKVLNAQGEVSFDDRLALENAVRDTKDAQLLAQWNSFTAAKDESAAQQEMKKLLSLLVAKMNGVD
jgi:hypothetical protein